MLVNVVYGTICRVSIEFDSSVLFEAVVRLYGVEDTLDCPGAIVACCMESVCVRYLFNR